MIKDKGDFFELNIVVDKVKKKLVPLKQGKKFILDEDGNKIQEEIEKYDGYYVVPTTFYKEGITLYGKATNDKNKIYKTRATIFDKYTQKFYIVKHTDEEIEQALLKRSTIGFKWNK